VILFVGGALHATQYNPPPDPPMVALVNVPAADSATPPPPSFVHPGTGDQYLLVKVAYAIPHPITGQAVSSWENTVYVHAGLTGNQQQQMMALSDAVTRWWFTTHGTRRSLSTTDGDNSRGQALCYVARCDSCDESLAFENLLDRAHWMRTHIEETGHELSWSDVLATVERATNGGPRQSDVQKG
jgi:hypothetical protein